MQLTRETINYMFSRFQSIVNKVRANKVELPYKDGESCPIKMKRALKLLYALDQRSRRSYKRRSSHRIFKGAYKRQKFQLN